MNVAKSMGAAAALVAISTGVVAGSAAAAPTGSTPAIPAGPSTLGAGGTGGAPAIKTLSNSVGPPFACPISGHGQFPATCVWVTSGTFRGHRGESFTSSCPTGYRYPYLVALGFDPLWQDLSRDLAFLRVFGVSNTYGRLTPEGKPFSYSGNSGMLGYVGMSIYANIVSDARLRFVCSNKGPTSALP